MDAASELVKEIRTETIPTLESAREGFDQLFARGERGVTLAQVIAIRNRLIQTRSSYLDALFELSQARADLAAAVGDPTLTLPLPPHTRACPGHQMTDGSRWNRSCLSLTVLEPSS